MIPLYLRFAGLNSYRAMQEIDFSELAAEGLFGIFGVTGAGKSTILDAMTLALFGVVNRAPRGTQGMINAREKSCFVSFSFRLGGHIYCAERMFERAKNDPFAAASKSCRLVRDETTVLADKSDAVNTAVKELLNMDCARFCQTVVLPQGQFDQLLRLKPAERSAMLEELFRYQAYGKSLSVRANTELRLAEAALQSVAEQQALLGQCDDVYLAELERQAQEGAARVAALAQESDAAARLLHQAEALAARAAEHQRCLAALRAMADNACQIEAQRAILQRAERAEPLRELLQQAASLHQRSQSSAREAATRREAAAQAAAARQTAEQAAAAANAAWQQLNETLAPRSEALRLALHDHAQLAADEQAVREAAAALQAGGWAAAAAQAARVLADASAQQTATERRVAALRQATAELLQRWEQATQEAERLRRDSAAAFLAASLRDGEPCPVCGSTVHQPPEPAGDETAASACARQERQAKQVWQQSAKRQQEAEAMLQECREKKERAAAELQRCEQELATRQAALHTMEEAAAEKRAALRRRAGCDDPQAALDDCQARLRAAQQAAEAAAEALRQATAVEQQALLAAAQAESLATAAQEQLAIQRDDLLRAAATAGFAEANEARRSLLPLAERQALADTLRECDAQKRSLEENKQRLEQELAGFSPAKLEEARSAAQRLSQELAAQREAAARLALLLEKAQADRVVAAELASRRSAARARADVLKRLANLLKGNAFVRYLARGAMQELAYEASQILVSLTAHRYQLELLEDAKGSDFIIVDHHSGGMRRQATGLSGGETFLVSLALSLALSRKIEMNSVPLGFFFLDEGFGSLDESSLDAALQVLEKLPSDTRAVGVITHVRGVRERVPRYLEVTADPAHGARVTLRKN